jgi:hypothetical protein
MTFKLRITEIRGLKKSFFCAMLESSILLRGVAILGKRINLLDFNYN